MSIAFYFIHIFNFLKDWAVNYWISKGAQREKLIMGLGTYGRTFKVTPGNYDMGSSASGAGTQGPYTREAGFLAYNEVIIIFLLLYW